MNSAEDSFVADEIVVTSAARGRLNRLGNRLLGISNRTARVLARRTVYRWYERRLAANVRAMSMPNHVAIIIDGNRRFARRAGHDSATWGHKLGANRVTEVIRWCDQLGINVVTLWGLSTDNFDRPVEELQGLLKVIQEQVEVLRAKRSQMSPRRVHLLGRREMLPLSLRECLRRFEEETAMDGPWHLNFALAYGGRDEIMDAVRNLVIDRFAGESDPEEIARSLTPDDLRRFLYASPDTPDPDLIIRTSGEVRLSGFLLWQSAHSELYFSDALWPDFRRIDFLRAIRSFQRRERRFGR